MITTRCGQFQVIEPAKCKSNFGQYDVELLGKVHTIYINREFRSLEIHYYGPTMVTFVEYEDVKPNTSIIKLKVHSKHWFGGISLASITIEMLHYKHTLRDSFIRGLACVVIIYATQNFRKAEIFERCLSVYLRLHKIQESLQLMVTFSLFLMKIC